VAGPIVDFALLTFHNAAILASKGSGPFFYLSKVESAKEAKLWDDIFTWTEEKLGLEHGTTKACVLIENVLSSFEMEEILFNLRSAGKVA
jgi:malate synthase